MPATWRQRACTSSLQMDGHAGVQRLPRGSADAACRRPPPDQLVCAYDELQAVGVVEVLADVLAVRVPCMRAAHRWSGPPLAHCCARLTCHRPCSGRAWLGAPWRRSTMPRMHPPRIALALTCPARADAPAGAVVWVRPQQVTHGALMRHLHPGEVWALRAGSRVAAPGQRHAAGIQQPAGGEGAQTA